MGRGAEGSCPRGHLFSMLTSNPCDTIVPLQRRQPLEFTSTSFLDLALDARYRLVPSTACLAMSSGSSELRNQSDSLTESADLPSGVTPGHQGRVTASWPFLRRQPIFRLLPRHGDPTELHPDAAGVALPVSLPPRHHAEGLERLLGRRAAAESSTGRALGGGTGDLGASARH